MQRVITVTAILAMAAALPAQPARRSGLDLAGFDRSVRPQDDLFRFVNGAWLDRTAIQPERVIDGALYELTDKVESDLRAIIEEIAGGSPRPGSLAQQVGDLYASMMDEALAERLGLEPVRAELERIEAIRSYSDLAAEAGYLSSIAAGGPFAGTVAVDAAPPGLLVVQIAQGGTLLPDRDYYLKDDAAYRNVRARYEEYLALILTRAGRATARADARGVLGLETELAKIQLSNAELRDPSRGSAKVAFGRLSAELPGFDWNAWAKPQGIDRVSAVIFAQPTFFRSFAALVPRTPLETWKAWLLSRYLTASAPFLDKTLGDARFEFFGRLLSGQQEPRVRWKRAVSLVSAYLGDAVGRLYVEKHFPPAGKARVQAIADRVLAAYRESVRGAGWMTPAARRVALDKLSRMGTKIGYPSRWRRYDGLVIKRDDLVGNIQRAQQFENRFRMARVDQFGDRGEWLVTPQSVNAYYSPGLNEIVLPAAMLQPPLFQLDADDAVNYGGIGAVIGHEVGHALDEHGRGYDGDGGVRRWWQEQDEREFRGRAKRVAELYGAFSPAPGLRVDGNLTLSENIGDLAGLSVAYRAYRLSLDGRRSPTLDGFTGEQRVFLGWAQLWRGRIREEYLRQWLLSNPYAPPTYRTNGPPSHVQGFYDAFDVKPGDRLYLAPERRVRFW